MDGLLETVQASARRNLFWGPPPRDYFFERAEAAILRMPEDIRENFISWYQLLSLGCLGLFLLHECAHAFWKTEPEQCIALSGLGELPCSGPEREYAADALAPAPCSAGAFQERDRSPASRNILSSAQCWPLLISTPRGISASGKPRPTRRWRKGSSGPATISASLWASPP